MDYGTARHGEEVPVVGWRAWWGAMSIFVLYLYQSCSFEPKKLEPCAGWLQAGTRAEQVIGQTKHVNASLTAFGKKKKSRSKRQPTCNSWKCLFIFRKRFTCGNITARFYAKHVTFRRYRTFTTFYRGMIGCGWPLGTPSGLRRHPRARRWSQ